MTTNTKLKQFPLMGFAAVIAVTLGMFLLLSWHVYNTFRVSRTLANEYASGLALGSQILASHLTLMYDAHLVVRDGDRTQVSSYRSWERDLHSYLEEARELGKADPAFAPLASLGELSLGLRQRENAAIDALANSDGTTAEALLHSQDYRSLGWAFEARVADSMNSLNRSFSVRLHREGNRELAALAIAFVIFGLSAAVWATLIQRTRAWGHALQAEMAQRREAEAQLLRAQQMEALGRLAAGISHDFNNILSVVQGFVDVALNRLARDHPAAEALGKIGAAARQGTELIRSLLTFSGRAGAEMGPVELGGLVAEAARLFHETLPATVSLEVDVPDQPEGYWVWASHSQLRQVLLNLVLNARDAMPEGGRLRIGLAPVVDEAGEKDVGWVRLQVRDTGVGIPEELRDRVFEPFFTTKPRDRGTGLGLAVVAAVVEEHQGRIRVDSAPGEGTCFSIELPGLGPVPVEAEVREGGAGKRVLIGLADAYAQGLVLSALEADGYRVRAAESSQALRDAVTEAPPDVVLLDGSLATLSLGECLRAARGGGRAVPILVLGPGRGELTEETGADVLTLDRPFLMSELIRLIHNLASDHDTLEITHSDR